jgi:hypothetical protein
VGEPDLLAGHAVTAEARGGRGLDARAEGALHFGWEELVQGRKIQLLN